MKDQIMNEVDLLTFLNIEKNTLDKLRREQNFPYVRINMVNRAYILEDVFRWLKERKVNS